MLKRTFKYRLYPSRQQAELLNWTLACCCELYNAALQERRDAWRINRASVGYYSQSAQLPEIKRERPELKSVYSQVFRDTLQRVERAFQAFYARVKRGERGGFPRFKSASRYDSFTYPQSGFSIEQSKLRLSKIGLVKIKLHRPIAGTIKNVSIKRELGRWYACFSVEISENILPPNSQAVALDLGINSFVTFDSGVEINNPRFLEVSQAKLRRAHRKVSRRKKVSNRRRKAVKELQRIYARIKNQRADFHHKLSRQIVNENGLIIVEDLNIEGLAKGFVGKSVKDAGWSYFIKKLAYKAEEAGRKLMKVDAGGTSQRCRCGNRVPKTLSQRTHECDKCGLKTGRNHAAALEILRLGLSLQDETWPSTACVS